MAILNLLLPSVLGYSITNSAARWGVVLGTVFLLTSGVLLSLRWPEGMKWVNWGSLLTAVSQCFPALQLFLGILGFAIAEEFGWTSDKVIDTFSGGLMVTTIVGVGVVSAAAGLGLCLYGLFRMKAGLAPGQDASKTKPDRFVGS